MPWLLLIFMGFGFVFGGLLKWPPLAVVWIFLVTVGPILALWDYAERQERKRRPPPAHWYKDRE